jgi:opacity protein-like surface antigen
MLAVRSTSGAKGNRMNTKTAALTLALLPALAGARDLGPGTFELSGRTGLDFGSATAESSASTTDLDISTLSVNGDALFYVVNNFGIGLGVSYDKTELDNGVDSSESSTSLIGPEAKLNLPIATQASVVLMGAAGRMATEDDLGDADGWAFLVGGGLRFFPADSVSLDAMISYTTASMEHDLGVDLDVSGWDLGLGLSVYFGGR